MKFPDKILVLRVEDDHTHFIGKYDDGNQFWGYETFVITQQAITEGEDWQKYRREYTVLYLFDKEGNLVKALHQFAGTTNALQFDPRTKLENMISDLGNTTFGNIEIKAFQTEIDGFIFGLIPNEELGMLELQPSNTLSFGEPWDGEYYT